MEFCLEILLFQESWGGPLGLVPFGMVPFRLRGVRGAFLVFSRLLSSGSFERHVADAHTTSVQSGYRRDG